MLLNSTGQVGAYQSGITFAPTIVTITDHTRNPVLVTATRIRATQSSQVAMAVADVAGNVTSCDPILTTVGREAGVPHRETFRYVARGDSELHIYNDTPGLEQLALIVDGRRFEVNELADGEVRTVNLGTLLRRGDNTVTLEVVGKEQGSATVLIADQ
jgi:hypothetical protein